MFLGEIWFRGVLSKKYLSDAEHLVVGRMKKYIAVLVKVVYSSGIFVTVSLVFCAGIVPLQRAEEYVLHKPQRAIHPPGPSSRPARCCFSHVIRLPRTIVTWSMGSSVSATARSVSILLRWVEMTVRLQGPGLLLRTRTRSLFIRPSRLPEGLPLTSLHLLSLPLKDRRRCVHYLLWALRRANWM